MEGTKNIAFLAVRVIWKAIFYVLIGVISIDFIDKSLRIVNDLMNGYKKTYYYSNVIFYAIITILIVFLFVEAMKKNRNISLISYITGLAVFNFICVYFRLFDNLPYW